MVAYLLAGTRFAAFRSTVRFLATWKAPNQTRTMNSAHAAAKALQELGNRSDEVAGVLKAKKIQGVRNAVRMLNPIVRYVQAVLPDAQDVDVIEKGVLRITFRNGTVEHVALPACGPGLPRRFQSSVVS